MPMRHRVLLLIPSALKTDVDALVATDRHPTMDYYALADGLRSRGSDVDLLDYRAVERATHPLVQMVRKAAGRDAALALMGFLRRHNYDAFFTNGENLAIPLALLLKTVRKRPRHVTIGHRLSTGKKRLFFTRLGVQERIDTIFVYAATQATFARDVLKLPASTVKLIAFHADNHFYRPLPDIAMRENQICAAGLEWRDYPTLIVAVASMPDLSVKLAAASPWSKHTNETEKQTLPPNVDARRYDYESLRRLYAESAFVVVPLYENDFQAGVTTLLEAMAMGKAVIVTSTTGQTDVVADGVNGMTVTPGDVAGWQAAINRLREDKALRERLGANARAWLLEHATLAAWVARVADALTVNEGESV